MNISEKLDGIASNATSIQDLVTQLREVPVPTENASKEDVVAVITTLQDLITSVQANQTALLEALANAIGGGDDDEVPATS